MKKRGEKKNSGSTKTREEREESANRIIVVQTNSHPDEPLASLRERKQEDARRITQLLNANIYNAPRRRPVEAMLSKDDLRLNFLAFQYILTTFQIAPFVFDQKTKRLKLTYPRLCNKLITWKLWQLMDIAHVLFIISRTFGTVFFPEYLQSDIPSKRIHIPLMIICGTVFTFMSVIIHNICEFWPDLHTKLFNEFFDFHLEQKSKHNSAGSGYDSEGKEVVRLDQTTGVSKNRRTEKKRRQGRMETVPSKGFERLLLIYFPLLLYPLVLTYPVLYALDLNNPLLLVSIIPKNYQNAVTVSICLLVETLLLLYTLCFAHFGTYFPLAFMFTLKNKIAKGIEQLNFKERDGRFGMKTWKMLTLATTSIQQISLSLHLFNVSFRTVTFVEKFVALTSGVIGGFSFTIFWHENLGYSAIYLLFFMNGVVSFTGIFSGAYDITRGMENFKREISLKMSRVPAELSPKLRGKFKEYERLLESIPAAAIKVGTFRILERETILLFLDTILQNIVNMRITFNEIVRR